MIISKTESAKRQLETAVALFFEDKDPVAIHTLSRAAHEIFEVLCEKKGFDSILKSGEKFIKKEKVKEFYTAINKPKNFFKHADQDSQDSLDFNPDVSEFYLWDSCRMFRFLSGGSKPFLICEIWFGLKYPDCFKEEGLLKSLSSGLSNYSINNKNYFYSVASKIFDDLSSQGKL